MSDGDGSHGEGQLLVHPPQQNRTLSIRERHGCSHSPMASASAHLPTASIGWGRRWRRWWKLGKAMLDAINRRTEETSGDHRSRSGGTPRRYRDEGVVALQPWAQQKENRGNSRRAEGMGCSSGNCWWTKSWKRSVLQPGAERWPITNVPRLGNRRRTFETTWRRTKPSSKWRG